MSLKPEEYGDFQNGDVRGDAFSSKNESAAGLSIVVDAWPSLGDEDRKALLAVVREAAKRATANV